MLILALALVTGIWVFAFIKSVRIARANENAFAMHVARSAGPVAVIRARELREAQRDPRVRNFLAAADRYGAECAEREARQTLGRGPGRHGASGASGRGRSPR